MKMNETWPIRMPNDINAVFLAGVGFIRVPRGISFHRPRQKHLCPSIVAKTREGQTQRFTVVDTTGPGWQKVIYEAAKYLADHEKLQGRRDLRSKEAVNKLSPSGQAGLYTHQNPLFRATCQRTNLYFSDFLDAAACRLSLKAEYERTWQMKPKDVFKPLW